MGVRVFAPAKVNLCLHVTGQRGDGFHELDSIVAFASIGDVLSIERQNGFSLVVDGPEASDIPSDARNLVLKVASLFETLPGASFTLTKNVPVASGIGGGSADAAAAYRGLCALVKDGSFQASFLPKLLELGADIPMCLMSATTRVTGIGQFLTPLDFPDLPAVLVNPGVAVSTPEIFEKLSSKSNPPLEELPLGFDADEFVRWLRYQRNDLERPARAVCPEIDEVLNALRSIESCRLARMSGSGATCFGLFKSMTEANEAAGHLASLHSDWWIVPTVLGNQTERAQPS